MTSSQTALSSLWSTFWSPWFWLPPNLTWDQLESKGAIRYPNFVNICLPIVLSFAISFIRSLVEKNIFLPFGKYYGLKDRKVTVPENGLLEEAFNKSRSGCLNQAQVQVLAKKIDWSQNQVERWIAKRKAKDRPSPLVKIMESGWRFTYYTTMVIYGICVLWNKPYLWNFDECWINYPFQSVTWDIELYYLIELSCYWSMLFSQFKDVKRKDFTEMFIHHVATIGLMSFSWTCNFVRAGALVLITHDLSDIFMEAAKIAKYAGFQRVCDISFAVFFLVWVPTRLIIIPLMLYNSLFQAHQYFVAFPAFYMLNGLLIILVCLHIIWTYFILKILKRALITGQTQGDSRSSSESDG